MHSNFSDGSDDPEVLAEHAHRVGITTLSLTDHDTTESYPRMAAACQGLGIELIAGVEVSLKDVEAVKVREDGMNENRNLPIIQIQGGKPVVLFPAAMQQAALKPMGK
jgi:predicted metal-dependent phosphoesterase TrpH